MENGTRKNHQSDSENYSSVNPGMVAAMSRKKPKTN